MEAEDHAIMERVASRLQWVRGRRVLIDADLAIMYCVTTSALLQAVRRNASRFPPDFAFELSSEELLRLRSQTVISNSEQSQGRGGRRSAPYAFTEQGVAMLSSVLRSSTAVAVNIAIMRAFVELRRAQAAHQFLGARIDELEQRMVATDSRRDAEIAQIIEAIRQLVDPPRPKRRPLGFHVTDHPTDE